MESDLLLPRSVIGVAVYLVVLAMVWMIVAVGSQILAQVIAKRQLSRKTSGIIATIVVIGIFLIGMVRTIVT